MAKKIRAADSAPKRIRDVSSPPARVVPSSVASALGADAVDRTLEEVLAPVTLFAVRAELFARLQSSGGRPALSGTSRRAKIPLGDTEWADLERLAAVVSGPGCSPSAGQVASVLLSLSVRSVISQVEREPRPASTPLGRELAARAATEPNRRRARRST